MRTLILAASLLAAAPLSAQVGDCYDVAELGDWIPIESTAQATGERRDGPANEGVWAVPPRLRLSGERVPDSEHFVLDIPANSQQTPHGIRGWRLSGDTLRLVLSTGFVGHRAWLLPDGDGWRGRMRWSTDQLGGLMHERVFAMKRVSCDSPPPIRADADPPLPRSVAFGDVIVTLGEPLPPGLPTEPRPSSFYRVLAAPTGQFAGAHSVSVGVGQHSGRVSEIRLQYPPDFDVSPMIAAATRLSGSEPREGVPMGDRTIWPELRTWSNRTTRVSIRAAGERPPSVHLSDPRMRW